MEQDRICIRLTTPTGLPEGLSGELRVSSFTLNTPNGRIGVLPMHAPIVTLVDPGPLYYVSGGQKQQLDLGSGCLELSHDRGELLVESVARPV